MRLVEIYWLSSVMLTFSFLGWEFLLIIIVILFLIGTLF